MEPIKLKDFSTLPCIFNEHIKEITKDKLKSLKVKLDLELKDYDDHEEEKIWKLNCLTWIEFKLRDFSVAQNRNEEVMRLTGNANVTALLGRAWIALETGTTEEANTSLCLLDTLVSPTSSGREIAIDQSKAQLAYYFHRLRSLDLAKRSMDLFAELVGKQSTNYFWKFKLGLVHGRLFKIKAYISFFERQNHAQKALECYSDVIDQSKNTELIREAYTQIILLKTACQKYNESIKREAIRNGTSKVEIQLDNHIWRQEFRDLIQKTLSFGSEDSNTLSIVAEALRDKGHLDEAIKHLEKSLQLKPISKTFHYLGKCYKEKGDDTKARHNLEQAIEISLGRNFSAVYALGEFLKSRNLIDEALEKYRLITDQSALMVQWDYLRVLVSAYKQSAVILLEKAKQERTDGRSLKEKAEYYLLQVVNVNCILKRSRDKSFEYICDLFSVGNLEVPVVISSLRSFDFSVNNLRRELKSEFLSKKYEFAFTLVTLFEMKTKTIPQYLSLLVSKIKCYTAAHRIQLRESTVHFITKPLFASSIQSGSCEPNSSTLKKCIDVLILCDHKNPSSSEQASMLKKRLSEIFGLDVTVVRHEGNLKQDIDQSYVVFVIIDSQQQSRDFQDAQRYVAAGKNCFKVLLGLSGNVQASKDLSKFKTFDVKLLLGNLDLPPGLGEEFSDTVNELMTFYCSLI